MAVRAGLAQKNDLFTSLKPKRKYDDNFKKQDSCVVAGSNNM
jgi:hypothetical protein